jgi:hypothetical protein
LIYNKKRFIPIWFIFIFLLIALVVQYVVNVKYSFPDPHSFKGEYLYNPYTDIDTAKWQISNFHAHTHKFPGSREINARNTQYLDSLYSYLGYNVIGISDYQRINRYESKHTWYVPVYEHGYQYYKNHHLVLNPKKVSWLDYFFKQTLSNKQFVINQLEKDTSAVITLVHPILRAALSYNDVKYLTNYNCLEVIDNKYLFLSFYDTILSNGHPVFLMADDDTHNLKNVLETASCFNIINTVPVRDSILHALKRGHSFSVKLNLNKYRTNEAKRTALSNLPKLIDFNVKNDTISLRMNNIVKTIKFIGQEGIGKKSLNNTNNGSYFFSKEDTYIRTEIECMDGTLYFLNPVFRYNGILKVDPSPPIDVFKTWGWRSIIIIILILGFILLYYKKVYV